MRLFWIAGRFFDQLERTLLRRRTITIVTPLALPEIIAKRDLVKTAAVKTDIPGLVRVVIGYHKISDVGADNGRKQLQPLLTETIAGSELRAFKTPPVGESAPDTSEIDILVYLGVAVDGL